MINIRHQNELWDRMSVWNFKVGANPLLTLSTETGGDGKYLWTGNFCKGFHGERCRIGCKFCLLYKGDLEGACPFSPGLHQDCLEISRCAPAVSQADAPLRGWLEYEGWTAWLPWHWRNELFPIHWD